MLHGDGDSSNMNRYVYHSFIRPETKYWVIENGRCEINSIEELLDLASYLRGLYGVTNVFPADEMRPEIMLGWVFEGGKQDVHAVMRLKKIKDPSNQKYKEAFASELGKIDFCRQIYIQRLS